MLVLDKWVQLNRLIDRLRDADIDFVIVGGFACMLHGSSLVTRDLEFDKRRWRLCARA